MPLVSSRRATFGVSHPPAFARQEESDEALMLRIAQGDRHAFRFLVERYARRAHSVAQRLLFNRAEAEDAVQDVFTRVWVHAAEWDSKKGTFPAWFYRMLTNGCIDRQRKKKTVALDEAMEIVDPSPGAEQMLSGMQLAWQVQRGLDALPERQRIALTLCYYEGFSNKEAAVVMGVHVKALEGLLVRARQALRQTLAHLAASVE